MIAAFGLTTDPTMRHFLSAAQSMGVPVQMIDLAVAVENGWEIRLPPDDLSWVGAGRTRLVLDPLRPAYCRLIDLGSVSPATASFWHTLIMGIAGWLELAPGRVVNRPSHCNDNASKPLHEALLAARGFAVPPSFSGTRREDLLAFLAGGRAIAKALCGQRADCRLVTGDDFADYDERSGPVHLQRFVAGEDVRAHVIGETVIAARIRGDGVDYRLDPRARFEPIALPADLCQRLVAATAACGLAFAGWDLRLASDACWVLEVNPMPGYSYYDDKLDGAISRALIAHLRDG